MKLEIYSDSSHKTITSKFEVTSCGAFARFTGKNFTAFRLFGGYLPYCTDISDIESSGIAYVLNQLRHLKYNNIEIYNDDKSLNDMLIRGNFHMSSSILTMLSVINKLDCDKIKIMNHRRNNIPETRIAHHIAYSLVKRFNFKHNRLHTLPFNTKEIKQELEKLGLTYSRKVDNIVTVRNAYSNF